MLLKKLLVSLVFSLIGVLILLQTNVVLAIASDPNNPITSAITSAINNVTNNNTQNNNTQNDNTQNSNVPITTSITQPTATPSAAPLTSPVLYEISPKVAKFGDTVTLKTYFNVLHDVLIHVGDVLMPQNTYEYKDSNTSVSFVLTVNELLETGKKYLVNLFAFGSNSNSLELEITATPAPTQSPKPTPTPVPVAAPILNTVFPNPATWGTHVVLTGSNITNSVLIYLDDYLITPQAYTSASEDGTSITFTMPLFTNHRANQTYKLYLKQDGVKSNEVDFTIAPSLAYNTATPSAKQVLIDPEINLDTNHTEVLIAASNFNSTISIPSSVTNPTLNFNNLLISNPYTNENFATFNNALTINSSTSLGTVTIQIPTATQVTGPADWNGIMNAPKILDNTGIKPTADAGKTAFTSSVIEVGLGDTPLTFDKAVRVLIPGQAGKFVGYQRGSVFTKIATGCNADTQTAGDNLPDGGDCYISTGNDLVIWTKHFTKFATYTQASNSNSTTSQSSSGSSNAQAPVCGDSKPTSAPKLVNAFQSGRNQVTLVWSKASDPVSYYLVAYGTKQGVMEYGNPNVGGKDTISYVVKGLSNGKTYYFKVRAGNGCMPGEYSNEVAVKASGDSLKGPAAGFRSGILSSTKIDNEFKPITAAQPTRITKSSISFIAKVFNFLTHLFGS